MVGSSARDIRHHYRKPALVTTPAGAKLLAHGVLHGNRFARSLRELCRSYQLLRTRVRFLRRDRLLTPSHVASTQTGPNRPSREPRPVSAGLHHRAIAT